MGREVGRGVARTLDREVSRGPFLEANRRMARVMGGWRSRGAARGVPKRGVRRGVGLAVGCKAVQVRCEVKGRIARGANRDMRRKMGCVVSRVARSLMRHGVGVVINRAVDWGAGRGVSRRLRSGVGCGVSCGACHAMARKSESGVAAVVRRWVGGEVCLRGCSSVRLFGSQGEWLTG